MKLQINKLENVGLKRCNDHKAVIQYSNDISIRILIGTTQEKSINY